MSSPHDFDHQFELRSKALWDRPLTRRDLFRYGGMLGFGAVGAGMLAACTPLDAGVYTQSASPVDLPPAKAKYLVIVIVDGCRSDYLYREHVQLPTLEEMMRSGTRFTNAWTGCMESTTPACHAAIGTGRFAKNNGGILGFYWEDPTTAQYGEHVNLADSLDQNTLAGRQAVDPTSLEDILQANKIPTVASYLKGTDPTAKVYAGAGEKFYAADAAGGPDADYITYIWNYGGDYYRGLNIGGPNHKLVPDSLLTAKGVEHWDYSDANYGKRDIAGKLLRNAHGQPISPPRPGRSDTMTVNLAKEVIKREKPRIVILNLGEMDYPYGHLSGGILSPEWWTRVMTNADRQLGSLMDTYRELGIFDQTVFMFLGDHGMVPITQQVDREAVVGALKSSGASFVPYGHGIAADFHTAGFMWLANPPEAYKAAEFVDDAMVAGNLPGVLGVYFRGDNGGRPQYLPSPDTARTIPPATDRAYRYLLETVNGPTAPHVVVVFQEHTGISGSGGMQLVGVPPHQKSVPIQWYGDHGGVSWSSHSIPLIMSGPGIRRGHTSGFPARLVDLAPTGLRLLGVPYTEMDGIVLADALQQPFKSETAAERVISAQLVPIVNAMKRQANVDIQSIGTSGYDAPPPMKGIKSVPFQVY